MLNLQKQVNTYIDEITLLYKVNSSNNLLRGIAPLFVAPNNFVGNDLKGTGVLIVGDAFQGASIFKKLVPKKFTPNVASQNITYVISTETEKSTTISNMNKFTGHYSNFSGNLGVEYVNEQKVSNTSLFVLKEFSQNIGTYVFDYEEMELSNILQRILDPSTAEHKDPEKYKNGIRNFLETYGHYYVSSYELYGTLLATWSIETESITEKNKLSIDLGSKISGGNFSFEDVNKFINESTSSYTQATTKFSSLSIGVTGDTQTIEQIDALAKEFTSHITQESAAISKVYISSWITLPQISEYLLLIDDPKLHKEVLELFNESNLTQDIWDRSFSILAELRSINHAIKISVDDPYNNLFWGFLVDYAELPIKEIQEIQKTIEQYIDMFGAFETKTFVQQFLDFQSKYLDPWNKIKEEMRKYSTPLAFSGTIDSGFYEGVPTKYQIYAGSTTNFVFDPQKCTVNQELLITPTTVHYLPAAFTNVWTRGVLKFTKNPNVTKTNSPFALTIECGTEWTLHTSNWHIESGETTYYPKSKELKGYAAYPAHYAGFECNTIVDVLFKEI